MARRSGKPTPALPRAGERRRPTLPLVVAVLIALGAAGAGAAIGFALGRPGGTEAVVADLQRAEAERDVQQIKELTALARETADRITPALAGLRAEDAAARIGDRPRTADWQRAVTQAAARFDDPPSGTTATNVARGGFRSAVDQAALAVDTYAAAAAQPAAARPPLVELAARQALQAAVAWSVAATQLDQINVDAGYGHQHVYIELGSGEDAFTPDNVPEGTGS
jgi:hypothetical protein